MFTASPQRIHRIVTAICFCFFSISPTLGGGEGNSSTDQSNLAMNFSTALSQLEKEFVFIEKISSHPDFQRILANDNLPASRILKGISYRFSTLGNYYRSRQRLCNGSMPDIVEISLQQSLCEIYANACVARHVEPADDPKRSQELHTITLKACMVFSPKACQKLLEIGFPHVSSAHENLLRGYAALWELNDKNVAVSHFQAALPLEEAALMLEVLDPTFDVMLLFDPLSEQIGLITSLAKEIIDEESAKNIAPRICSEIETLDRYLNLLQLAQFLQQRSTEDEQRYDYKMSTIETDIKIMLKELKRLEHHDFYSSSELEIGLMGRVWLISASTLR